MKFVCDNCKAKYQIGDEKVAGKTLRMKCRRCGHLIQVAASVTESSVSTKLPTEPVAGSAPAQPGARWDSPALGPPLEDSAGDGPEEGATIVRPSPLFLFEQQKQAQASAPSASAPSPQASSAQAPSVQAPGAPPRPVPAPAPSGIRPPMYSQPGHAQPGVRGSSPSSPPRIVPPARASMRPVPPANASTPGGVPRAPLRSTTGGAATALAQSPATAPIRPALASASHGLPGSGLAHAPSSPALYGGFVQAVAAPTVTGTQLPTEDWYVGIAGVPLGPVRLSVLREKASQGQVDGASLVWREGFEEWLPIAKVAGLVELVEEAKHARGGRGSMTPVPSGQLSYTPSPPVGATTRASAAPIVSGLAAGRPSSGVSVPEPATSQPFDLRRASSPSVATRPSGESDAEDRAAVVVLGAAATSSGAGASARATGPVDVVKDPFAAPPAGKAAPSADASSNGTAAGGLEPYGLTTTAAFSNEKNAPFATVPPDGLVEPTKKKGLHPMVWAFIAMAAAFGGVAAWALFLRKPEVVYVPQAGQTAETPLGHAPPPPPTGATDATSEDVDTAEALASGTGAPAPNGTGKGSLAGTPTKPGETAAPFDTSGFGSGPGPSGPSSTDSNNGGSGGPLSSGEAQGVVAKSSPRVRRSCWDPQVAARSSSAPNSVKVTVTLKIAPNGSVTSAQASGGNEKHYPGLTSCVQGAVRSWKFPPSGEGGTVVVPFGFNAQ